MTFRERAWYAAGCLTVAVTLTVALVAFLDSDLSTPQRALYVGALLLLAVDAVVTMGREWWRGRRA